MKKGDGMEREKERERLTERGIHEVEEGSERDSCWL